MGKLTDRTCKSAKADNGKDVFLGDGGGLYLRVRTGSSSAKVWLYRFKSLASQGSRWLELGTYPGMSLSDARLMAAIMAAKRRSGIDPIEEKRSKEEQEKQTKEDRRRAVEIAKARMTVIQLFERWEQFGLRRRKDKGAEARRSFQKDVFPQIGHVVAEDVKRSMIAACLDKVVERGSPVVARNLLGELRQMFGFAIKREYVENDPTSHLKRDDFGKKIERDRILSDEEIKSLVARLPEAGLREASVAAIWIMLSTCCRVGEISRARWVDVDFDTGIWRIPPDNSKNGKEHVVFLSDFSKRQFERLKASATNEGDELSPWVLPATHREGHVCLKSLTKQIGDRQRGDKMPMKNRTKQTSSLTLSRGRWTPHDLRRTGATIMGRLGTRPDVIEKCLNHVEQNALVRIYQRQLLEVEQAEAWSLLGERLQILCNLPRGYDQ